MIKCPYCNEEFKLITHRHLKKHNKTNQQAKEEFPDLIFTWNKGKTKETDERVKKNGIKNKNKVQKYCLNCGKPCKNKFCCTGCGTSYNNRKRWRNYNKEEKQLVIDKIKKIRNENDSYVSGAQKAKETKKTREYPPIHNKGKTNLEHYGIEKAKEISKKQSEAKAGKTWEVIYGLEQSIILKQKLRKRLTGYIDKLDLGYGLEWFTIRSKIIKRDNYICQVCGNLIESDKCKIHHIIPYKIIGEHIIKYLVLVCQKCHLKVEPKSIPTEEIRNHQYYIEYYINKGGKLPLETTRRAPIIGEDIVRTMDIDKTIEDNRNIISLE